MKNLAITLALSLLVLGVTAQQDRHYSMFYASPMAINPGATGFFPGDIQMFTGYKNQWKSISPNSFKTISASVDGRMMEGGFGNGFLGVGANFYNDVTGDSRLTTNLFNLSLDYAIEVAQDQKLSLGLQPSVHQRYINNSSLTWDEQWNGSTFDNSLNSGESLFMDKTFKFDIAAGMYYYARVSDEVSFNAGVSAFHLLKPSNSLIQGDESLYQKYVVHGGGEFSSRGSKLKVAPNLLYFKQGPNQEISVGSDFKYLLKQSSVYTSYYEETSVSLGAYMRLKDAFYTTLFFNWSGFSLGLSYDLNLSNLSIATNGRGGMEMLLRYRIALSQSSASSF